MWLFIACLFIIVILPFVVFLKSRRIINLNIDLISSEQNEARGMATAAERSRILRITIDNANYSKNIMLLAFLAVLFVSVLFFYKSQVEAYQQFNFYDYFVNNKKTTLMVIIVTIWFISSTYLISRNNSEKSFEPKMLTTILFLLSIFMVIAFLIVLNLSFKDKIVNERIRSIVFSAILTYIFLIIYLSSYLQSRLEELLVKKIDTKMMCVMSQLPTTSPICISSYSVNEREELKLRRDSIIAKQNMFLFLSYFLLFVTAVIIMVLVKNIVNFTSSDPRVSTGL